MDEEIIITTVTEKVKKSEFTEREKKIYQSGYSDGVRVGRSKWVEIVVWCTCQAIIVIMIAAFLNAI